MCGIHGFTFQDTSVLRKMHASTHHRGPDDEGFFESADISFAHNRLSIIDLSPGGRQPMTSADGRWTVVFNGEIYNYRALRAELEQKGVAFRSSSDTEVLLYALAQWGEAALKKLNGIFAFALWDRETKQLLVARDAMGVKPLYYFIDGTRFFFSSEIKALLSAGLPRQVDTEALQQYLRFLYVPAPRTMFAGIKKLPAGHVGSWREGAWSVRRWWNMEEGASPASFEEARQEVRTRVLSAVERQLVSDRPVGIFLSGGIDSTAVLAAMRQATSGVIKTFSVGYESQVQSEKYNADANAAEISAQHFGAEHARVQLTAQDVMNVFEKTVWHMDEPIANHVQTSTYLLAQFAKPEITVALGGDGGDELFGGYPRYWFNARIDAWRRLPFFWQQRWMESLAKHIGKGDMWEKVSATAGVDRWLAFVLQKEAMLQSFSRLPSVSRAVIGSALGETHSWYDTTNQLMALDLQTWLPEESLMRTDKMTLAHGLEERVPLLDTELVAYAMRIPSAWKLDTREQGKHILIEAMRDLLPPHVLQQEKRAWMSPAAKWLRGPMLPWAREILSATYAPGTEQYFDFEALRRLLDDHVACRTYALHPLWSAITFQVWYKLYIQPTSL